MPNRNYQRGRALEYLMKDKLEKQGWFVIRSAGSHSVDLVAIRYDPQGRIPNAENHQLLFISCKLTQYEAPAARKELIDLAAKYGARAMLTIKDKEGEWALEPII